MMMDGMGMMIWGVFSFLLGLVLVFLFIVAVVAAVKWVWGQRTPFIQRNGEDALEILKKRYAKGEINKEEFDRIRKDIQ
ncbi:MAG: SHOCT domain-containing protein [Deltaproteobacteria bacterium]|nr:MAG: SHOCT domain-containing protein [Deltaproteobacteria bacterium]